MLASEILSCLLVQNSKRNNLGGYVAKPKITVPGYQMTYYINSVKTNKGCFMHCQCLSCYRLQVVLLSRNTGCSGSGRFSDLNVSLVTVQPWIAMLRFREKTSLYLLEMNPLYSSIYLQSATEGGQQDRLERNLSFRDFSWERCA